MNVRIWILSVVVAFAFACSPPYLKTEKHYPDEAGFAIDEGAEIPDTVDTRQVLDVVLQYRSAIVRKDVGSLRRLISERYYDNAATTETTKDDYGVDSLPEVYELMAQHTDQIKYDLVVKDVEIDKGVAFVDYEFRYAYQYTVGEQTTWDAGLDVNRLNLESENGEWKIVSGL